MEEIKRILFNRRQILLLVVLLVYNICNLAPNWIRQEEWRTAYQAYVDKYEGMELETVMADLNAQTNNGSILVEVGISSFYRDVEYLKGFDARLENIQKQAQTMGSVSIFAGSEFAKTNIRKTAQDYKRLEGLELTLGNNDPVENMLSYNLSNTLIGIYMITVVYAFLKERKRGLWNMVCASPNGRLRLLLWRFGTIVCGAVGVTVLFTASELICVYSICGGLEELGRMVQSIEACSMLTIPMTIGQFWIYYTVARMIGAFFIAIVAWFLMELIADYRLIGMVWVLAVAMESVFREILSESNVLYQVNLFTYLNPEKLLTTYVNLNIFGKAVNHYIVVGVVAIVGTILIFGINGIIYEKRKPISGYAWVDKIIDKVRRLTAPFSFHISLVRHELYKMLISGKGIIIVACAFWMAYSTSSGVGFSQHKEYETALESYYRQTQGPITEETQNYIVGKEADFQTRTEERNKLTEQLNNGEITFEYYQGAAREFQNLETEKMAFEQFKTHVASLQQMEHGYILPHWVYEHLFAEGDSQEKTRDLMWISVITIVLILFIQLGVEKKTGMDRTQNASPKGRQYLAFRKHIAAWILSICISVGIWLIYTLRVMDAYYGKLPYCQAPVCCISFFSTMPSWISVLGYWIIVVSVRTLVLCAISSVAFLAMECTKKKA